MSRGFCGIITHPDPDLSAPYFAETLTALRSVLGEDGEINPPVTAGPWGLVLLAPAADDPWLREARRRGMPAVIVNGEAEGFPGVDLDNAAAARDAARHLLDRGHRRLGLINGRLSTANGRDRRDGFLAALAAAGAPPALQGDGFFDRAAGRRVMEGFLSSPVPPTAVFAANDHMALGALEALRAAGRRAAVAGFDDIPAAAAAGLTSVRQPLADMAREAAEALVDWRRAGRPPWTGVRRRPGRLVARRTTDD